MAPDVPHPLACSLDATDHLTPEELIPLLGAKGSGLATMTAMGLPVPPGFTLTTEACRHFGAHGWTAALDDAVRAGLAELERTTGRTFGRGDDPFLVSVRAGAEVSMPGMLDTVLDVGMTDEVAAALARRTGDPTFSDDTLRRSLAARAALVGPDAADDPVAQVVEAVQAVFRSWSSPRAVRFRDVERIPHSLGTAVTVQVMVFGNLGEGSGTGVAFTRDPSTGAPGLVGDFLVRAQGEDVVAGRRATAPLAELSRRWPDVWDELVAAAHRLEHELADMVDIEFTVERRRLWLLQARAGRRSAAAAVRIAVDLAEDPTFPLSRAEAVRRCRHLLDAGGAAAAPAPVADATVVASGLAASPGRAVGVLCVDVAEAVRLHAEGVDVVLVRPETSPADVHGMAVAVGLVTAAGGLVSHAAIVARSWGLPAVVGAGGLEIADDGIVCDGVRVRVGEVVTVDGDTGRLLLGRHAGSPVDVPEAAILRSWAASP